MNRKFLWFLILIAFAIGCGSGSIKKKTDSKAPDFTLPLLSNNSKITLSEINRERPVLLAFWASWCPSCVEEIPVLNELQSKYNSGNLEILSVNVQESRDQVTKFLQKTPITYPIAFDEEGEVASKYGLVGLPAAVLLAKGGEILYYGFTLPENLDQYLEPRSV